MKKINIEISFLILFIGLFISCVQENEINPDKETNPEKIALAEKMITTADFQVPTVDGYITTVSYNGMTLARTSTPITIKVPKIAVSRGDDDLTITYAEGKAAQSVSNLWQTVLFEDTKYGDYDYNDLIFHAHYQKIGNKLKVSVQPIALGATKDIRLRFKWTQSGKTETVNVVEDCRKELFGGAIGFVNTRIYDEHFSKFVKEFEVELPNEQDVVDIAWFINVGDRELIYAINQNNDRSLDDKNRPYGFALTDVSRSSNKKLAHNIKYNVVNDEKWNKIKPSVDDWAKMPIEPEVPKDAISLKSYNPDDAKANSSYVLKKGESYNGTLSLKDNTTYYILGNLALAGIKVNDNTDGCKIVICSGGNVTLNMQDLIGVEIWNFGNITWSQKYPKFSKGAKLYSNKNIEDPSLRMQVNDNCILAVHGDCNINNIILNYGGRSYGTKVYFNSINAVERIELYNDGLLYVDGSVSTPLLKNNGNNGMTGTIYVGCRLSAATEINLNQNSLVYIKGSLNAPKLTLGINTEVYLASSGVVEAGNIVCANVNQAKITVIGDDYGLLLADEFYSNSKKYDTFFYGSLDVIISKYYKNNKLESFDGLYLASYPVLFNNMSIKIAETACSNGFNSDSSFDDNGVAWFAYPLEGVDITSCYNFDKWMIGDFDFSKLPGAKVFDINDNNPVKGLKLPIYKLN